MSVDFFKTICTELPRQDKQFGICDDQDNTKAYTDTASPDKWIAIVTNNSNPVIDITFTPIDNCIVILKPGTKDKESTCDGMLTFSNTLYLVELKQMAGGWMPGAVGQLENTMKLLLASHDLKQFPFKKAFACNKKHPNFTVIDNELNKWFFKNYGFRIDAQTEIVIK